MTTKNMKYNREKMSKFLKDNLCEVTFTKTDGTERIMNCTLMEEYLPKSDGGTFERDPAILAVWDVDKKDWRSFRVSSVTNFVLI
jgi:hypothetical protein